MPGDAENCSDFRICPSLGEKSRYVRFSCGETKVLPKLYGCWQSRGAPDGENTYPLGCQIERRKQRRADGEAIYAAVSAISVVWWVVADAAKHLIDRIAGRRL